MNYDHLHSVKTYTEFLTLLHTSNVPASARNHISDVIEAEMDKRVDAALDAVGFDAFAEATENLCGIVADFAVKLVDAKGRKGLTNDALAEFKSRMTYYCDQGGSGGYNLRSGLSRDLIEAVTEALEGKK